MKKPQSQALSESLRPKENQKRSADFSVDDVSSRVRTKEDASTDQKWSELKIYSKNICRRSYHSAVVYEDRMYVYGGYEVNEGILSDFYEMMIQNSPIYQWKKINLQDGATLNPGALMRHTAVTFNGGMYVFGGNSRSLKSTNNLWRFDLDEDVWEQIELKGKEVPCSMDSHCAAVDEQNKCMYVFGGFSDDREKGGYQNKLWKLNLESLEWECIGTESLKTVPSKRAGASIALSDNKVYMFGGTIVDVKFNDLWEFDLATSTWTELKPDENDKDALVPESRNGHTLMSYKSKLVLFGGIHDITHEKNDMYVYNIAQKKWKVVDSNTSHSFSGVGEEDVELNGQSDYNETQKDMQATHKKGTKQNIMAMSGPVRTLRQPVLSQQNDTVMLKEESTHANNQLDENRKKRTQMKKQNLLQEFELKEEEKKIVRPVSPTTETMKNSIVTVGNPMSKAKYALNVLDMSMTKGLNNSMTIGVGGGSATDFGQNKMVGRRPCARDGHSAVIAGSVCYIFGGDRHMMSYNDLYAVDLGRIVDN